MKRLVLAFVAVALLVGCREKTEAERLAKWTEGLHCRTYRSLSEKAAAKIVDQHHQRHPDEPQLDVSTTHAVVGLLWVMRRKYRYAYAEADLIAAGDNTDMANMSLALKTVALYGMKLPQLSAARYSELKTALAAAEGTTPEEVETDHKLLLIGLILVSVHHGDPELAQLGADALGATAQVDYLRPLVASIVEAKEGNLAEAAKNLEELRQSEQLREHALAVIREVADMAQQAKSGEEFLAAVRERLPMALAERLLDDLFTDEEKAAMLAEIRRIPEMILPKGDNPEAGEESPGATDDLPLEPAAEEL